MPSADAIYYTRRARQSETAMNAAHDRTSQLAHAKLMRAYVLLGGLPATATRHREAAAEAPAGSAVPIFGDRRMSLERPAVRASRRPRSPGGDGLAAWDNEGGAL